MGVILAVLAALEGLLERLRLVLGRLEGILDRLGGILGRLGGVLEASWALLENLVVARWWHACGTVVEAQRAPIRIFHDFPDIITNIIRNIRNDMRKEIRIMILLKPPGGEYRRRSFLISAALWTGKKF